LSDIDVIVVFCLAINRVSIVQGIQLESVL
jgi:hypothetical protein